MTRAPCACYHGYPCTRSTRCAVEAVEVESDALRAENEKLRNSAASIVTLLEQGIADLTEFGNQVETAENRIRDLQSALVKYGHHIPECEYLQDTLPCTCGFEALRSGLGRKGEHDAASAERDALIAALRDLVDYTDPEKDVSLDSAGARVERARALLERLGAM